MKFFQHQPPIPLAAQNNLTKKSTPLSPQKKSQPPHKKPPKSQPHSVLNIIIVLKSKNIVRHRTLIKKGKTILDGIGLSRLAGDEKPRGVKRGEVGEVEKGKERLGRTGGRGRG